MLRKIFFTLFFIIVYLNINNILSICIQGDNCPYYQGYCDPVSCVCLYGYKTLISPYENKHIYCNYKQKYRWTALILELFLPPVGLFYLERYIHSFIKFIGLLAVIARIKGNQKDVNAILCYLFIILYFIDLYCLSNRIYLDGNRIELL